MGTWMDNPHGPWLQSEPLVSEVLDFDIVATMEQVLLGQTGIMGNPAAKSGNAKSHDYFLENTLILMQWLHNLSLLQDLDT
jgi:hypothetical protein